MTQHTLATIRLPRDDWAERARAHAERADRLTAGWRARRQRHETDPTDDFLYTYYPTKPALLRRWHPGAGVALEGADGQERAGWKWYRALGDGSVAVDVCAYLERRGATVDYVEALTRRALDNPVRLGCFGMHEWAMVYREPAGAHRHPIPLRLGEDATDRVVEATPIQCTHFDAYRFFTPEARGLNEERPTRERQPELDQAGCLHANMDVYKWASKLGPLVPGELLLDAFDLARRIREVDMRASPYDVARLGLEPIPVETPEGKHAYAVLQRGFADEAQALRGRLLEAIAAARAASSIPFH